MSCPYIRIGGFMSDSICEVTKKTVTNSTYNNLCSTFGAYTDCVDYKSGSGGCVITTAVCEATGKADDCEELTVLRRFRDEWRATEPGGVAEVDEYYQVAPRLCDAINALEDFRSIYQHLYDDYIVPCVKAAKNQQKQLCYDTYKKMFTELRESYGE